MKSEKKALLVLTSAGMEITWRYAWSSFLIFSILHHPFPLPVAIIAFATAAFFTRLSGRRNWRRIQAVLLHLAGFFLAALLIVYRLVAKIIALKVRPHSFIEMTQYVEIKISGYTAAVIVCGLDYVDVLDEIDANQ